MLGHFYIRLKGIRDIFSNGAEDDFNSLEASDEEPGAPILSTSKLSSVDGNHQAMTLSASRPTDILISPLSSTTSGALTAITTTINSPAKLQPMNQPIGSEYSTISASCLVSHPGISQETFQTVSGVAFETETPVANRHPYDSNHCYTESLSLEPSHAKPPSSSVISSIMQLNPHDEVKNSPILTVSSITLSARSTTRPVDALARITGLDTVSTCLSPIMSSGAIAIEPCSIFRPDKPAYKLPVAYNSNELSANELAGVHTECTVDIIANPSQNLDCSVDSELTVPQTKECLQLTPNVT
ncbi:unnamed protein product, partial [Protopolystoma xenopodis]